MSSVGDTGALRIRVVILLHIGDGLGIGEITIIIIGLLLCFEIAALNVGSNLAKASGLT